MWAPSGPWRATRKKHFGGELLRNPLILATVSGLIANLIGVQIPFWLEPTVTRIGQASLALGLMAAGAGMQFASLRVGQNTGHLGADGETPGLPLLALGVAMLFRLDPTQTTVLLMFSAVPTASSCYVLAARMGYDGAYVAGLVTLSTLLGIASLPFALGVLAPLR